MSYRTLRIADCEYVTSTLLGTPDPPSQTLSELVVDGGLSLGLITRKNGYAREMIGTPGYVRQPVPRWTITSTPGVLMSTADVEFQVSWNDTKPERLMLFNGAEFLASGEVEPGRAMPARPGQPKIIFPRGAINIRKW